MADGIPCQYCSFLEGSHKSTTHHHFKSCIPCDDYAPLNSHCMQEIELRMSEQYLSWQHALPRLETNYTFDKYFQPQKMQ